MQAKKLSFLLSILFGFSIILNIKSSEMTNKNYIPKIFYAKNLLYTNNKLKENNLRPTFLPQGFTILIIIFLPIAKQLITDICTCNYEDSFFKIGLLIMPLILIFSYINILYKTNKFIALNEIVNGLAKDIPNTIHKHYDKKCLICLNGDEENLYINVTCGHFYHKNCITQWVNTSKDNNSNAFKCILCKKPLIKLLQV